MKSYGTTKDSLKKAVDAEWQRKEAEYFELCKKDIIPQILAVCMFTLKIRFSFGTKRMNIFFDDVMCTLTHLLSEGAILGATMTTQDLIDLVKKEYGIDLDEEIRKE
jgi:hypothetical protein